MIFSCKQSQKRTFQEKINTNQLSLWNDTPQRDRINDFLLAVIDSSKSTYVPIKDRIAVFDFDGTVGCEKPMYMEVIVAMEQLCKLASKDSSLLKKALYKAACDKDFKYINAHVYEAILQAFLCYNQETYLDSVSSTTANSLHSRFNVPYSKMYYAPMLELINYLKKNNFDVYIVSGSEEGFLRAYGEDYLYIERKKTIGSTVSLSYKLEPNNISKFIREKQYLSPKADGSGKAELIRNRIGKQPIFAFGNTMGDYEMLTYSGSSPYTNLELILIHDDSLEYVYHDYELEEKAKSNNWVSINMKDNFKIIFPFKKY
ncbi:HAD family hydrolase [Wocania ichthyoenteri]|uniref:HAD family hydrolase n=1 Tax=Wocania ichthyoenteri TaxID=1230531 RepID=UPI00053F12AC|nr:HAD family hydrolase [Wocania ichthyoenteri]